LSAHRHSCITIVAGIALFGTASTGFAAGIDYENGLTASYYEVFFEGGDIHNNLRLDDPYDDYDLVQGGGSKNTYMTVRGNGGLADSYSDSQSAVTNPTGATYSTSATVNRSALSDTGFSLDASLNVDAGDGSMFQQDQTASYGQAMDITVTETTTFYITHSWDGVQSNSLGHLGSGNVSVGIQFWDNVPFCNWGDASCEVFGDLIKFDENSDAAGTQNYSVTLGPGDYLFNYSVRADYDRARTDLDLSINNSITVSTVPVPAAVWLFGSALVGLRWFRRKA
jgi:hypothetical protein